ncbi:unnamed protein product [Effrenium voratum]|nr:unnamed protein product [Effrenium voratum]
MRLLRLSSQRLCSRLEGLGLALERRIGRLSARKGPNPLARRAWQSWVLRLRRAQQGRQVARALRFARPALLGFRAWARLSRQEKMASASREADPSSLLLEGLEKLHQPELLRLCMRLSRALFEELQEARHSLAYAQERLSQLQHLVVLDSHRVSRHTVCQGVTSTRAKQVPGTVRPERDGLRHPAEKRRMQLLATRLQRTDHHG